MTDTATEPGTIDGSTESLRGLEKMGQSLATLHEENAASLAETSKALAAIAEERQRAADIALTLSDAGDGRLGRDLMARIQAYIDAVAQAASLEDAATALAAEAKVETDCAETARAFSEDAGSFANQMADVRQTERLGEFEQGE